MLIPYAEQIDITKENRDMEAPYFPVNLTSDNLWLLTEDDNYIVSETGDYLVIY